MKISIPYENYDRTNGTLAIDILGLPHSKLRELYVNGNRIPEDSMLITSSKVRITGLPINTNDRIDAYVDVETRRINIERYATIVVAVIGMISAITVSLISNGTFRFGGDASDIVVFEPDQYGLDQENKMFRSIVRWERPSEQNYAFSQKISDSHMAWAYVRFRGTTDDIRAGNVENPIGPFPIRNGTVIEYPIPPEHMERYRSSNLWLQLVVVALPRNMKLSGNMPLSSFGNEAKILLAPSIRPRP
jgi:hypothetical protein